MSEPRFHALLPARDEADIIGQSLRHMLTWADAIYVFDTGSVDETWEIVQSFAEQDKRVIPLKKDAVQFSDSKVRGWIFHQARKKMRHGDWFLRVDADEFYHIPPPEFVKTRMRQHESIAYRQYYDFCLTSSEAKAWEAGQETLADRQRPIEERRPWFIPAVYTEPRLCRYRETMQWPPTVSFPFNAGFAARARLPIRHYPHRDPVQLSRRCQLRSIIMSKNQDYLQPKSFHWFEGDWRKFIAPDNLPELKHWRPGTELPECHFTNHLPNSHKRVAQRLTHGICLPILDRMRPRWPEEAYPQRISQDIAELLEQQSSK